MKSAAAHYDRTTSTEPALRAPTPADVTAIVDLFAAAYGEARVVDADEVGSWLTAAEIEPDHRRVLELHGRVVGYCDLVRVPRNDELELCLAAPGHETQLLEWMEAVARGEGLGGTRAYVPDGHVLEELLRVRGYGFWLSSLTMRCDLAERPPPTTQPPVGIELHSYTPVDAKEVIAALNEAFADDPFHRELDDESFVDRLLDRPGFDPRHWHLARDGHELAGVALAFPQRPGAVPTGFVDSLAVREPWRRRGLGECLLRRAFVGLHAAGARRVELGVVADNPTGAVRLYERVGMMTIARWNNWVLRFSA